jgi:tetratricopeptide (TPR) repeat protein
MKKYQESLADRDRAVELEPRNPEVYIARGGSYHLLGQHDKGLADRTAAIRMNPTNSLPWTARGDAYFLLGRWDEALADFEQATRLDPSNRETAELKAVAKQHVDEAIAAATAREKKPETASVVLPPPTTPEPTPAPPTPPPPVPAAEAPPPAARRAPSVEKTGASAAELHTQGRKLIQEEKFAQAIDPLTEALKLDPAFAIAFNARGYCYSRLRKFKEAVADFDEAIKLNPAYGNAYTNRSAARRGLGDKTGADADLAKARDLLKPPAR